MMKSRKSFLFSFLFATLVFGAFTALLTAEAKDPKAKKPLTCEQLTLKYRPQVQAFAAKFVKVAAFDATAARINLADSDNLALARLKYGELTPEQRRKVWQNKFKFFYEARKDKGYAPAQQAFIQKIVDEVLPIVDFSGNANPEDYQALKAEAESLFSKRDLHELFSSLSTTETAMKVSNVVVPTCSCRKQDEGWDCPPFGYYCDNGVNCLWKPGCGILWIWSCDGLCMQCSGC